MKACRTCKRELKEYQFHKNNKTQDGLTPDCKDCNNKRMRDFRLEMRCVENYKQLAQEHENLKKQYAQLRKMYDNLVKIKNN